MHEARLRFSYPAPIASAIEAALSPEREQGDVPKTRASLERDNTGLLVRIEAEDLASLRAAVNGYVRWIDAASRAAALR